MESTLERLGIAADEECRRIQEFLRRELQRPPPRHGYVVGLSGGLDSAVTAALVRNAVGPAAVLGVLLPERDSQPESAELAQLLASELGIETVTEDLTEALAVLGVYERRERVVRERFPELEDTWKYRLVLPTDLRQLNVYSLEVVHDDGVCERARLSSDAYRRLTAATNVKQRLRMARLYEHAERRAFLVAGTTNRTELVQGYFVRYGDGGVDVEPLAHLYKTQVFALGRYLDVPSEILERPPSPDTFSAAVGDDEFFFRRPYAVVDRVLAAVDDGEPVERAAAELGLTAADGVRIRDELARREHATRRSRELPPALGFRAEGGSV